MIVKVQLAIGGHTHENGAPLMLVYDRERSIEFEGPAPAHVVKLVGRWSKAFFFAHVDERKQLVLADKAPWQEW